MYKSPLETDYALTFVKQKSLNIMFEEFNSPGSDDTGREVIHDCSANDGEYVDPHCFSGETKTKTA